MRRTKAARLSELRNVLEHGELTDTIASYPGLFSFVGVEKRPGIHVGCNEHACLMHMRATRMRVHWAPLHLSILPLHATLKRNTSL